jgi:predicted hydrocarbon binding protein
MAGHSLHRVWAAFHDADHHRLVAVGKERMTSNAILAHAITLIRIQADRDAAQRAYDAARDEGIPEASTTLRSAYAS